MMKWVVPCFLPSTSAFHFNNSFPRIPLRSIGIPGVLTVPIGNASDGLCGMAFAARDYFEAGRLPPTDTSPPSSGRLFDYLVARLFDSFNLPYGPLSYLELMNPRLPDGDPFLRRFGLGPHGRTWRMLREEWPRGRSDIDRGDPSPLGLVKVKSLNPLDLGKSHQVLAYGYELDDDQVTLLLYDPNHADRDDVTIVLPLGDPKRSIDVRQSPGGARIHSFFRVGYRRSDPP